MQKVELLVFIHIDLGDGVGVLGLAPQREYGLRVDIAALGNGARGGVSLGDKDGTLKPTGMVGIVVNVASRPILTEQ